jgi:hypothetical protein
LVSWQRFAQQLQVTLAVAAIEETRQPIVATLDDMLGD